MTETAGVSGTFDSLCSGCGLLVGLSHQPDIPQFGSSVDRESSQFAEIFAPDTRSTTYLLPNDDRCGFVIQRKMQILADHWASYRAQPTARVTEQRERPAVGDARHLREGPRGGFPGRLTSNGTRPRLVRPSCREELSHLVYREP